MKFLIAVLGTVSFSLAAQAAGNTCVSDRGRIEILSTRLTDSQMMSLSDKCRQLSRILQAESHQRKAKEKAEMERRAQLSMQNMILIEIILLHRHQSNTNNDQPASP